MTRDFITVRLESDALPSEVAEIAELRGRETISKLFEFELLVVTTDPGGADPEELIGANASLVFERDGIESRRLFGMIASVRDRFDTEVQHSSYRMLFVPRAFRMTLHETLDVFMDLSVPEIVAKKLQLAGLGADVDYELRLYNTYPKREFVVQYKETDLAFVSRLCEHLGICFFFEHRDDHEVIVFTDENVGFSSIAGEIAAFRPRGERRDVYRLEYSTRMIPTQYVVRDYNYRNPLVDLMAIADTPDGYGGRVLEYGAHFKTPEEGKWFARVRAEEQLATRRTFDGESALPAFSAGARFVLEGHLAGDLALLLTEVTHDAKLTTLGEGKGERTYSNTFHAIPAEAAYRPPRITPKPKVHGVLTGHIDAYADGKYAELDAEGRYRVRFLFDTSGAPEGRASRPMRMMQSHAGPGYGMHFPLRPGIEVVLTCIDGDPDRPIIAGTVPNPQTMSPVLAGNAARNIIRTGGGNEINISDTEGSERIKLSTPHGKTVFQLGAKNAPEDGAILTTEGAQTSLAQTGVFQAGMATASFSVLMNMAFAHTTVNVADWPYFAFALLAPTQVADVALNALQSRYRSLMAQATLEEKKDLQAAAEKNKLAKAAEEECAKCREALRAEIEKLSATDANKATLLAKLEAYDEAASEADDAYLALIGVMEDRNAIINVNREGGNMNFEVVMQNDVDDASFAFDYEHFVTQKTKEDTDRWNEEYIKKAKEETPPRIVEEEDVPAPTPERLAEDRKKWEQRPSAAEITQKTQEDTEHWHALNPGRESESPPPAFLADARKEWDPGPSATERAETARTALSTAIPPGTAYNTIREKLTECTAKCGAELKAARKKALDANEKYSRQLKLAYGKDFQEIVSKFGELDDHKVNFGYAQIAISVIVTLYAALETYWARRGARRRFRAAHQLIDNSKVQGGTARDAEEWIGNLPNLRPFHKIGSAHTTEIIGEKKLLMWAETAMLLGSTLPDGAADPKGQVIISGQDAVLVTSPNRVEIGSAKKVVVSTETFFSRARDNFKVFAKGEDQHLDVTNNNHPGQIELNSEGNTTIHAGQGNVKITSEARNIGLNAHKMIGAIALDIELKARTTASMLSGAWKVCAGNAEGVIVGSDAWQLKIEDDDVRLGTPGDGAELQIRPHSTKLQTAGSSLELKKDKIEIVSKKFDFGGAVLEHANLLVKEDGSESMRTVGLAARVESARSIARKAHTASQLAFSQSLAAEEAAEKAAKRAASRE